MFGWPVGRCFPYKLKYNLFNLNSFIYIYYPALEISKDVFLDFRLYNKTTIIIINKIRKKYKYIICKKKSYKNKVK